MTAVRTRLFLGNFSAKMVSEGELLVWILNGGLLILFNKITDFY